MLWALAWGLACNENNLVVEPPEVVDPMSMIEVTPDSLDFGEVGTAERPTEQFTITSVGDATLFFQPPQLDDDAFEVALDGAFAPLAPGESITATVTFVGEDPGVHEGLVSIASEDQANPLSFVELIAGRVQPSIQLSPDPLVFDGRPPGMSEEQFVTVTNDGGDTLTVEDAMVDNGVFWVDTAALPFSLEPGESAELSVTFEPDGLETSEGNLVVFSDAAAGDDTVSLMGEGISASLSGRICDPSGTEWVVDAEVWVEVDDDFDGVPDRISTSWTDEDGYFLLTELLLGTYTVHVQKGRFTHEFEANVVSTGVNEHPSDECLDQGDLKIALVRGVYDNMEGWLSGIGLSYDLYRGDSGAGTRSSVLFEDPTLLATYDLVFIECGQNELSSGTHMTNLEDYVDAGGVLYMNDLVFYSVMQENWPSAATQGGTASSATGKVYDTNAIAAIGTDTVNITLSTGVYINSVDSSTTTVIDQPASGSIFLFTRPVGSGYIAFSSLHVQYQTPNYQRVMQEVILTL